MDSDGSGKAGIGDMTRTSSTEGDRDSHCRRCSVNMPCLGRTGFGYKFDIARTLTMDCNYPLMPW